MENIVGTLQPEGNQACLMSAEQSVNTLQPEPRSSVSGHYVTVVDKQHSMFDPSVPEQREPGRNRIVSLIEGADATPELPVVNIQTEEQAEQRIKELRVAIIECEEKMKESELIKSRFQSLFKEIRVPSAILANVADLWRAMQALRELKLGMPFSTVLTWADNKSLTSSVGATRGKFIGKDQFENESNCQSLIATWLLHKDMSTYNGRPCDYEGFNFLYYHYRLRGDESFNKRTGEITLSLNLSDDDFTNMHRLLKAADDKNREIVDPVIKRPAFQLARRESSIADTAFGKLWDEKMALKAELDCILSHYRKASSSVSSSCSVS